MRSSLGLKHACLQKRLPQARAGRILMSSVSFPPSRILVFFALLLPAFRPICSKSVKCRWKQVVAVLWTEGKACSMMIHRFVGVHALRHPGHSLCSTHAQAGGGGEEEPQENRSSLRKMIEGALDAASKGPEPKHTLSTPRHAHASSAYEKGCADTAHVLRAFPSVSCP